MKHEDDALSAKTARGELARDRACAELELMQVTLERLDRLHPTLRALVSRRAADALKEEARAAQERLDRGEARPLEGIPFGVKDLEDVEGLVTSYGIEAVPRCSRRAGLDPGRAIEGGGCDRRGQDQHRRIRNTALTKNLVYGATASPWDPSRSPGGSSGGSAAALAGGLLPLVTAHDGGGSIRVPASFVGAFGLKPSHGRVPVQR